MTFKSYLDDEAGAITIDWVALSAALLILGVGIVGLLQGEVQGVIDTMEVLYVEADNFTVPS